MITLDIKKLETGAQVSRRISDNEISVFWWKYLHDEDQWNVWSGIRGLASPTSVRLREFLEFAKSDLF